jgi:hypothetical protein
MKCGKVKGIISLNTLFFTLSIGILNLLIFFKLQAQGLAYKKRKDRFCKRVRIRLGRFLSSVLLKDTVFKWNWCENCFNKTSESSFEQMQWSNSKKGSISWIYENQNFLQKNKMRAKP